MTVFLFSSLSLPSRRSRKPFGTILFHKGIPGKMSKVFISWYDGQNHDLANEFFGLLKEHGFDVEHSPYSPHSGLYDERWKKWYDEGLPKAINQANIFIAVITPSCDSSTWMMIEFQEAYLKKLKTGRPQLYYIRFDP